MAFAFDVGRIPVARHDRIGLALRLYRPANDRKS